MSTPHILTIPCRKPAMTSNEQRRWHWSKQSEAITTMHWQVRAALSAHPVAPQTEQIAIRVTQYPPTRTARVANVLGMSGQIQALNTPLIIKETPLDLVKSDVAAGAGNTMRPLTHSLEQARRG